jgi:hypothetical protein
MGMPATIKLDGIGVPTYFITDVIQEDAGNGVARIWNCSNQGGVLVPECKIIVHSTRLVQLGMDVHEFALQLYRREQINLMMANCHH